MPQGRLQLFAGNHLGANFIALDLSSKTGTKADVWYLSIPDAPYQIGRDKFVAQTLTHSIVDCDRRTFSEPSSEGFNSAGERVVWMPPRAPEAIEARSTYDFIARVMCDGATLPASNIVVGHAAAVEMAKRALASVHP